jgi:hypothetical protein
MKASLTNGGNFMVSWFSRSLGQHIRDHYTHHQLQPDLIEHQWALAGN